DERALLVADGGEHHVGPEARAVLAHAPRLFFVAAGFARQLQLAHALAGGLVLLGVQDRQVAADDLGRLIADDALGAGVPRRHVPVGVEHEDGVVADAVDEQAQAQLATAQLLLDAAALAQIARDLGAAAQRARGIVQRRDDDARPEARAVLAQAPAFLFVAPL